MAQNRRRGRLCAPQLMNLRVRHKQSNSPEGERGDDGRGGNGEHPGPDDTLSHAPANGGKACRRTYTDDRTGDGVRGTDRNAVISQHEKRCGARTLSAKSTDGTQLGD